MVTSIEELKTGDIVIFSNRYGKSIVKVEYTTPKQIVLVNGNRIWKKDGTLVGRDMFVGGQIKLPSSEDEIRKIRQDNEKVYICNKAVYKINPSILTYEQCVKLKEILEIF